MQNVNGNNAAEQVLEQVNKLSFAEKQDFDKAQSTYFDMSFTDLVKATPSTQAEQLAKAYEVSLRRLTQMF